MSKAAEKLKEENVPISTIKLETIKERVGSRYDEAVENLMSRLEREKNSLQSKINDAIRLGNWKGAQKLIDSAPPYLAVYVNPEGTKATVSISDYASIKKIFSDGKKSFVENVSKILEGNLSSELVKSYKSWYFEIGGSPTDLTNSLARMFGEELNNVMGINPPKGVNIKSIPEGKKIEFVNATVPKDKLPIYITTDENKIICFWPPWITGREKELTEVVPKKL